MLCSCHTIWRSDEHRSRVAEFPGLENDDDPYLYPQTIPNSHCNSYTDVYAYARVYSYTDPDADAESDADPHANLNANSHD
ncbi:MAG: hypothetical protein V3S14_15455 [Anaerolineae bacterium]